MSGEARRAARKGGPVRPGAADGHTVPPEAGTKQPSRPRAAGGGMSPSSSVIRPVCFAVALSVLREGLARGGAQAALGPRDRSRAPAPCRASLWERRLRAALSKFLERPFPPFKKKSSFSIPLPLIIITDLSATRLELVT